MSEIGLQVARDLALELTMAEEEIALLRAENAALKAELAESAALIESQAVVIVRLNAAVKQWPPSRAQEDGK